MGEGAARLWEAHQDQNILQLQNVEGVLCVEEECACQVFIHSFILSHSFTFIMDLQSISDRICLVLNVNVTLCLDF